MAIGLHKALKILSLVDIKCDQLVDKTGVNTPYYAAFCTVALTRYVQYNFSA